MYSFEKAIRTIPDFPSAGIAFKDIAPLLAEPAHFSEAIMRLRRDLKSVN